MTPEAGSFHSTRSMRLAAAGVRVPVPYNFLDGVLLMELVADRNGDAAPRLNDVPFSADEARLHHATLLREVVRMLCAGVVPLRHTPVSGRPRSPLCLMGVCFDCLVEVDGMQNVQSCLVEVRAGMQVKLQLGARHVEATS